MLTDERVLRTQAGFAAENMSPLARAHGHGTSQGDLPSQARSSGSVHTTMTGHLFEKMSEEF
eukprot:1130231-Heterocapsa_arctica.AAC.1